MAKDGFNRLMDLAGVKAGMNDKNKVVMAIKIKTWTW